MDKVSLNMRTSLLSTLNKMNFFCGIKCKSTKASPKPKSITLNIEKETLLEFSSLVQSTNNQQQECPSGEGYNTQQECYSGEDYYKQREHYYFRKSDHSGEDYNQQQECSSGEESPQENNNQQESEVNPMKEDVEPNN